MSDDNCLDATGTDGIVKLIRCHGMGGNQAWLYEAQVLYKKYYSTRLFDMTIFWNI